MYLINLESKSMRSLQWLLPDLLSNKDQYKGIPMEPFFATIIKILHRAGGPVIDSKIPFSAIYGKAEFSSG